MEMTELLKILVCPACKGQLKPAHDGRDEGFACEACQVVYPIRDEIPIMLVNEAIPMDAWQKGKR